MTEITEELIRIKAREAIIHLVEGCEFLDLVEDTDLDARFGDLTPDEAEAVAKRVGEAIDTATTTVTWPDRLPGVEPDLHALLDILETGAHDGPALVAVLRSIDGGPDFSDVMDAAECSTFVDRLLEWKNNAVATALAQQPATDPNAPADAYDAYTAAQLDGIACISCGGDLSDYGNGISPNSRPVAMGPRGQLFEHSNTDDCEA